MLEQKDIAVIVLRRNFVKSFLLVRSKTVWGKSTKYFRKKLGFSNKDVSSLRKKFVQSVVLLNSTLV